MRIPVADALASRLWGKTRLPWKTGTDADTRISRIESQRSSPYWTPCAEHGEYFLDGVSLARLTPVLILTAVDLREGWVEMLSQDERGVPLKGDDGKTIRERVYGKITARFDGPHRRVCVRRPGAFYCGDWPDMP